MPDARIYCECQRNRLTFRGEKRPPRLVARGRADIIHVLHLHLYLYLYLFLFLFHTSIDSSPHNHTKKSPQPESHGD